jgi:hypothetical protein
MPQHPFEVPFEAIEKDPDSFVKTVFSSLVSEFLMLPKGDGFVEYPVFEAGYERLKQSTSSFRQITAKRVLDAVLQQPIALVVLRCMLGFSPPEWADITSQRTESKITRGDARTLDRKVRMQPKAPLKREGVTFDKMKALIEVACQLLNEGVPDAGPDRLHRLDKADTKEGARSIRTLAGLGVPYAMLLYERFLGRPFAGHRDSVSELVGENLESAIEDILAKAGISYRKTKRAERIRGFDQAPDFIVPSESNPKVVIEAKIAEDDGTARDKVTRILHLCELSEKGLPTGEQGFEVIACIAGRGFGVRREDMKRLLLRTKGKVFTLKTLGRLVECTSLRLYRTRPA